MSHRTLLSICLFLAACGSEVLDEPATSLTPLKDGPEARLIYNAQGNAQSNWGTPVRNRGSLWSGDDQSLFGDRRARKPGDILTVIIEIDDEAQLDSSTDLSRTANDNVAVGSFFGMQNLVNPILPGNATTSDLINGTSTSSLNSDGNVQRSEKIKLTIAATIVSDAGNGTMEIFGSQEIRINNELRELIISGLIRPTDISRRNEISYQKIASARISYGGRGIIVQDQRQRGGQKIIKTISPF